MHRSFALAVLALLVLVALCSALPRLSAANPPPPAGTILTVAGTGKPGFSGDGGKATEARLNAPHGLALDAAGNLYIGEHLNNRVRKVTPDGIITTIAGTGRPGFSGDGGKATEAWLSSPDYLASDGAGNLYIGDSDNARVRKVSPDGLITTVAGSGKAGYSGDNGPATAARLNVIVGLAVDTAGSLYIADLFNYRVRKVSADGIITTIAGTGTAGDTGDGGAATAAELYGPTSVAVDAAGNLFIGEIGKLGDAKAVPSSRVRKVGVDGIITTVAGNGLPGFSGDGGKATEAQLNSPWQVTVDAAGDLFIADGNNARVRKVTPEGIITTIAGTGGKRPYSGEGGPATAAVVGPGGFVVDRMGNLLFSDSLFPSPDYTGTSERVLEIVGAAAPGLLAGKPFPKP
jgi:sugar lactone lactonase YvrE